MKIETDPKGNLIFKEVHQEVTLETKEGNKLHVCMREKGFEMRINDTEWIIVDKDLNEIIAERARDMAVVFATKELWMQNPESAFTIGIPTALYNDVAERFDRWDKIKHVNEDLCEITVSKDLIPLFCEHPNFTNNIISNRAETKIIEDLSKLKPEKEILDKEFSIEDYLK